MSGLLVWAGVAIAGALAAYGRYRADAAISRRARSAFPWGTFAVNGAGSFLAGIVAGAGLAGRAHDVAVIGVLASFTTFSTWMLETHRLAEDGRAPLAAANVAAGAGAGLLAALAGWAIGGMA